MYEEKEEDEQATPNQTHSNFNSTHFDAYQNEEEQHKNANIDEEL